jgi:hypothetical protein
MALVTAAELVVRGMECVKRRAYLLDLMYSIAALHLPGCFVFFVSQALRQI